MPKLKYKPLISESHGYIRREDGTWVVVPLDDVDIKSKSRKDEEELLNQAKNVIEGHHVKAHPLLQRATDKLIKGGGNKGKMANMVEKRCGYKTRWGK